MACKSLTELANLHGSDKGTVGPSPRWPANNYTDIYHAYLEDRRHRDIAILEIGLGVAGDRWDARIVHGRNSGGASLKMWHDYFPHGRIYGIDINACPYLDNDRITTFVADQGSVEDLEAFTGATRDVEFDVIVDDGSHRPDHQQVSLGYFFRKLKPGGLYFIEDLADNGLGDHNAGRHACDTVRNTRRVLRHFQEHGTFPEPNALGDTAALADGIALLNFHVPRHRVDVTVRASLRRPFRTQRQWIPGSEMLCAIQKKT